MFSLDQAGEWRHEVATQRYAVPFFVKDEAAFRRGYPPGSRERCGPHHQACCLLAVAAQCQGVQSGSTYPTCYLLMCSR